MILSTSAQLQTPPSRIISLVPSITELLYDLGLEEEVSGITKFCVHPDEWFKTKTRVGGTKTLKLQIIDELSPDLIIANKEENERAQVEQLAEKYNVWLTDVSTLTDALNMIVDIGQLTGRKNQAAEITTSIIEKFNRLRPLNPPLKTAYFIWRDPYFVAGSDTFISDLMLRCGLENCFSNKVRYPEFSSEELIGNGCQLMLLSSEPYPFKAKHVAEINHSFPGIPVKLVDGEMFSWYGSRLLEAVSYFETLVSQLSW